MSDPSGLLKFTKAIVELADMCTLGLGLDEVSAKKIKILTMYGLPSLLRVAQKPTKLSLYLRICCAFCWNLQRT